VVPKVALDADGSNAKQLTHGEGGVGDYGGFDWSPDGSMIAYQRDTSDGPQIFTVRVSDGLSTRVTNEPQGAVDPGGWAPDGGSILFSSLNPSINHYSALSLDLTTGQTRHIVPDGSTPELSPDGAWIVFNSWLKPHIRLILANSDGSGRRVIARFDGDDGLEEWSPDSTQTAFVASTNENGFGTHAYDHREVQVAIEVAGESKPRLVARSRELSLCKDSDDVEVRPPQRGDDDDAQDGGRDRTQGERYVSGSDADRDNRLAKRNDDDETVALCEVGR